MDYGKTINQMQTAFPMKADLPAREPEILQLWERLDIYRAIRKARASAPKYVFHDGPPYSNGAIHLGQALNKILKDIVVRFKTLEGYDAPFIPGWDTHGLPNEIEAIKSFKLNRKAIDPVELRKKCAESALHYVEVQKEQFKRLGVIANWEQPYLTLQHEYESAIIKIFREMVEGGYIYKGLKPIYWCATCETALAEAEIEYKDKTSPSIYVKFKAGDKLREKFPQAPAEFYFLIWTTTPWTLPGNLAIALNPDADYVLAQFPDAAFIMAEALLPSVAAKLEADYSILGKLKGRELEGYKARHPFLERDSLVIVQDYVTLDEESGGTGCVHTAPGHGQEDFEAGQHYGLPVLVPVDAQGHMTAEAGPFAGLHYEAANAAILEAMQASGALKHSGSKLHSYPHCWRCRKPVIYRATEQWFVKLEHKDLRRRALDAIAKVQWVPDWGRDRIEGMVKDRPDWCISRQRIWGVPLPVFYCSECGASVLDPQVILHIEHQVEREGADIWFAKPAAELLPPGYTCKACGSAKIDKEMNIFDVWFESGASNEAVCARRAELHWPADLYLEGSDQHRGWFQLSLLPAIAARGEAPFKTVLTHGWVLDAQGHTMHKSLGNVINPLELIKEFGADVMRLFIASVDYTSDVRISKTALQQISENYRKIRNSIRFILGNLYDFDPGRDTVAREAMLEIDRWALQETSAMEKKIRAYYRDFQFYMVYHALHDFWAVKISALYFDILKDRLYTSLPDAPERRSAQTALYEILKVMLRAMSPILSFTAEEVWQVMPKAQGDPASLQLCSWIELPEDYLSPGEARKWEKFIEVRNLAYKDLEKAKADKLINHPMQASLSLALPEADFALLKPNESDLKTFLIVSQLNITLSPDNHTGVRVDKFGGVKCPRCWLYYESLEDAPDYPGVCSRCLAALRRLEVKAV